MKIRPLHDRILVKREEEKDVKKGGITAPGSLAVQRVRSGGRFNAYSGAATWRTGMTTSASAP